MASASCDAKRSDATARALLATAADRAYGRPDPREHVEGA
jgi:hypothetical protein